MPKFPDLAIVLTQTTEDLAALLDFIRSYQKELALDDIDLDQIDGMECYEGTCFKVGYGLLEECDFGECQQEKRDQEDGFQPWFALPQEEWYALSTDEFIKKCTKNDMLSEEKQEEKKMENATNNITMSMFGIECGINQDKNITSTIFGVAVKVADGWRTFDKKNRSIQNIGNINLGSFPVFLMPSKKVNVGDLIKDAGQYLYVTEVLSTGNIKAISVEDGTISERIPTQLIGGMKLFTKVVTFMNDVIDGKSDLGMLMLMGNMNGGAMDMNQMLPLMLLADFDKESESGADGDKESKPGADSDKLFKMMMLMSAMGGAQQNQLLPLLLMKSL